MWPPRKRRGGDATGGKEGKEAQSTALISPAATSSASDATESDGAVEARFCLHLPKVRGAGEIGG